jgi:acetone carboxylase gamma subunit
MGQVKRYISDADIQALVDNELDWETEKQMMDIITADSDGFSKRYIELMNQKKLLKLWWQNK